MTKKTLSYLGVSSTTLTLALALGFQNCTQVKFDDAATANLSSEEKASDCGSSEFTKFIDDQIPNSIPFSHFEASGYDEKYDTHHFTFNTFPGEDHLVEDKIFRLSVDNVVSQNTGTLIPLLNKLKISIEPGTRITYCQARDICEGLLLSGPKWNHFGCTMGQWEFDQGGFVRQIGAGGPGGHMLASRFLRLFLASQACDPLHSDEVAAVPGGVPMGSGIDFRAHVQCTTTTSLQKMLSIGDIQFKY